jgi:hypothetical protein
MDKGKVKAIIAEMPELTADEMAYLVKKLMKQVQQNAHAFQLSILRLEGRHEWAIAKIQELNAQIPCRVLTENEKANIEKFRVIAMGIIDNGENPRKAVKNKD